ncbi:hypothetical protein [Jeongeupia naejangsanensis]|uniref:Polysaccharide chain length determinant N-terminal domain-containing protein n=1 Tax=Jeongeupia naejangsanensis TaxID=613195 RepID=A0ABS2BP37_9NEIS|nr:hypothetical protein [Jeongeupia naejangsanensis]MBM3117402.1 hypothetical protein [Jeongeupia naejangsanensis]
MHDLLAILIRHKRKLIAAPIVAGVVALGAVMQMPNEYAATLRIAPSKNAPTYNWLLTNDQIVDKVAIDLELANHYQTRGRQATQRAINKNVKVTLNAKDGFLNVTATDASPEFAAKLANAFGKTLSGSLYEMRLLDISKTRYDLELRRDVAIKNRLRAQELLASSQIKLVTNNISPSEQFGIVSLAGIQAEATLQGGISDLAQSQVVKMQDQLASLQRLVVDGMKQRPGDVGVWIAAVAALQEQAYWGAMADRLDRRIELARAQERDELKITWAVAPDEKSGPRRGFIVLMSILSAGTMAVVFVLALQLLIKPKNA